MTLERRLAILLGLGTWTASFLLAAGLMTAALTTYTWPRDFLLLLGIGLFIALPLVRVVVTGLVFLYQREYEYALIAGVVLLAATALLSMSP